jgi:D-beta-D-heptose 7-phosphate kinase/D-beta-D-heptose 1-phosphate adenosyltransferase
VSHRDTTLDDLLGRLPGRRVLVIGDVMLDDYLWGGVRRLSPEAPVPVVEQQRRTCVPGGAGNAAANAAGLRAQVALAGIIGDDEPGRRLQQALAEHDIAADGLLIDEARPTTTKTRMVAQGQQVARLDHEQRAPLPTALEERLLAFVEERLGWAEACLVSDYAKGVVSPRLAQRVIQRATALGKPVLVDPARLSQP